MQFYGRILEGGDISISIFGAFVFYWNIAVVRHLKVIYIKTHDKIREVLALLH